MNMLNKLIDDFVKLNKNNWSGMKNYEQKILVEGFLNIPNYLVAAATIARAINEVKKYELVAIVRDNSIKNNEVKIFLILCVYILCMEAFCKVCKKDGS